MTTPSRASLVATWVAGLAVVLSGCSGADGDAAVTASGSTGPTFHRDVEPILQASCQSCHRAGGIAPFSLVTYDDAKTAAALIASTTAARTMPPWGEDDTDECAPPRGFEKDHPAADLLRKRQFLLRRAFTDKEVMAPGFVNEVVKTWRAARPWFDHMSAVLTTDGNGGR